MIVQAKDEYKLVWATNDIEKRFSLVSLLLKRNIREKELELILRSVSISGAANPFTDDECAPNAPTSEKIKKLRLLYGMSQDKLSKEIGVNKRTIIKWEKGERNVSDNNIENLARALHTTQEYLFGR